MKFVFLAAFAVAVAASQLRGAAFNDNQSWPWQSNYQYTYEVQSHTLVRLQEGASSGSALRARFIVRVKSPGELQARLDNAEHASIHQEIPKDNRLPTDLEYKAVPRPALQEAFEISVVGGRVQSLRLPTSMSVSDENLIKGLLSALQVDISNHRLVGDVNTYDKETQQGQFRKLETDVTGDCETLYTVLPAASEWRREIKNFTMEKEPVEITKSKSYGNCHHRVSYHFGVPKYAEWTGTAENPKEDQFIKRATTYRILAGQQGNIYKAETTNTIYVHPYMYGKQKAEVHSHVKLTLVAYDSNNEDEWKIDDTREVKNLLYAVSKKEVGIEDSTSQSQEDKSENQEEAYLQGGRRSPRWTNKVVAVNKIIMTKRNFNDDSSSSSSNENNSAYVNDDIPNEKESPFPSIYNKENPANAEKLIQDMAKQLQNYNNMPKNDFLSKFNLAVHLISSMSAEQLTTLSSQMESGKSSDHSVKNDMWMIYRDSLAQAGTVPAYKQIQSWIQKKTIEKEEAAQVVASMVNALRYPTKELMMEFFNLALSPVVREQMFLNNTALIAATKFINMGHVDKKNAHSYYPTNFYGQFARKDDDFVSQEIVPRLRQELENAVVQQENQKAQLYIKALGNLAHPSILEVFSPYLEGKVPVSNYLRARIVDSLKRLAHQRDHYARSVLYSILRNTAEHDDVRVAAAQAIFLASPTSGMMQAMAQMTNDDPSIQVRATLKSGIETAAKLKNPRYLELSRTAHAASSMLTKEDLGKMYSTWKYHDYYNNEKNDDILSKVSYTGSDDSLFPKSFEYALRTKSSGWSSISATISSIQHLIEYLNELKHEGQPMNSESRHKYDSQKISELLNMKKDPRDPLEAAILVNLMNQERYFTLNQDDVRYFVGKLRQYVQDLSIGVNRHYTKVLNQAHVDVVFPVAMGMPFIFKYREPTVIHIQLKANGEVQLPSKEQEYSSSVKTEIQFTYARNIDGSVGFMDTISNEIASVGVINKLQLNAPINMQVDVQSGKIKIQLEPQKDNLDQTLVHFSVWPYTTRQSKNTLTTVALDKTTKVITRKNKAVSTDAIFGKKTGTQFQLQGHSYSEDYRSLETLFRPNGLFASLSSALYQKDVALTHYNFRYLAKRSTNKRLSLTAVYDTNYNNLAGPRNAESSQQAPIDIKTRREELSRRVAAGINTARVRMLDLVAKFEDQSNTVEYIWTGAVGDSLVDQKIQYGFLATANPAPPQKQIIAFGTLKKPQISVMNFLEVFKRELKTSFEANVKYSESGNIQIQGHTQRTKQYTTVLKEHPAVVRCTKQIAENNYYQEDCHKALILAQTPDNFKVSVTYNNDQSALNEYLYKLYKLAKILGFNGEIKPAKMANGKLDVEVQMDYLEKYMNLEINSMLGEIRKNHLPISEIAAASLSMYYAPFETEERIKNIYSVHQYQPYCTVDGNKIRTHSNRTYNYKLSSVWHVVMQTLNQKSDEDQLVVLARRPSGSTQEVYISYRHRNGQAFEMEIKPVPSGSQRHQVNVNTKTRMVSKGDLVMHWDNDKHKTPLLQYYNQPDGVLMINIHENLFRAMYDGERLVVLPKLKRGNNRGLCGSMTGDIRDDYQSPNGLVDRPDYYGASYSLQQEYEDETTKILQEKAKQAAYQSKYTFTTILRSDDEWNKKPHQISLMKYQNGKVYKVRSYVEGRESSKCKLVEQVQYYEKLGEICITTNPVPSCPAQCQPQDESVRPALVVCRPKADEEVQQYVKMIQEGRNPQIFGVPKTKQFKVPSSCKA